MTYDNWKTTEFSLDAVDFCPCCKERSDGVINEIDNPCRCMRHECENCPATTTW